MKNHEAYPVLTIRPDGLTTHLHWEPAWPRQSKATCRPNLDEDRKKAYQGNYSKASKKRARQAILLMIAQAEEKTAINFKTKKPFTYKLAFITLTLPAPQGDITDQDIHYKCFRPFLKRMQRKYGLKTYFQMRERQKNGNVHYHILIDVYIDHANIRSNWNACLERLGFISRFRKKHGHADPNSTDVHSIRKVKNLPAYLIKYLTKEGNKQDKIDGKIWDCSPNLKTKERCRIHGYSVDYRTIILIEQMLKDKLIECGYAFFYPLSEEEKKFILPPHYMRYYEEYLKRVRTWEVCKKKEKAPV